MYELCLKYEKSMYILLTKRLYVYTFTHISVYTRIYIRHFNTAIHFFLLVLISYSIKVEIGVEEDRWLVRHSVPLRGIQSPQEPLAQDTGNQF
jgi:hypothetical protein